jgi:anthranilate synthase component 2
MKNILILDNYDSFTYNLVHLVEYIHGSTITVRRNDEITLDEVERFDKIILSPGPGLPKEAGIMPELVDRFAPTKSILGVCLGHQCIAEQFGSSLTNMKDVCHGLGLETIIKDAEEPLFKNVPRSFKSGRYHSWMVSEAGLPKDLIVTAVDPQSRIMALRHKNYDVRGVQFHPESILTEHGETMIRNWLAL